MGDYPGDVALRLLLVLHPWLTLLWTRGLSLLSVPHAGTLTQEWTSCCAFLQGLCVVGKERPEEAFGSRVFVYFCQIPCGRSRQLWQLSDGGFVVGFVFVFVFLLAAAQCPTVSPAHGSSAGSCSVSWDKPLSRPQGAVPGYLLQSHVCQCV